MQYGQLLHPEILAALGGAGHGSKVVIADGNYPYRTKLGPNARLVSLNLSPGVVGAVDVLRALVSVIPVEAATIQEPLREGPYALKGDPPIWDDYRQVLDGAGAHVEFEKVDKYQFFERAGDSDVALTIATAETALSANLLLQIGVVFPKR